MKNLVALLVFSGVMAACSKTSPSTSPSDTAALTADAPAAVTARATPVPATSAAKKYDGPFGLAMGIMDAELEKMGFKSTKENSGVYIGTPPRPLEGTDVFVVLTSPDAGICRIRAGIIVPIVNGSGDQLKAEVDRLKEAMETKYGKPSDKDERISDDMYRRNSDMWMIGLKEDSVAYMYTWIAGKTEVDLPKDIAGIEIGADATSTSKGSASIQYTFSNFKSCVDYAKSRKAASF